MVLNSGCTRLSHCLKSKPPLVAFVTCIVVFGVMTLSLGIYVQNKSKLENPDVLNWNTLLKRIGDLNFCLTKKDSTKILKKRSLKEEKVDLNTIQRPNVTVATFSVPITANFHRSLTEAYGSDSLLTLGTIPMNSLTKKPDVTEHYSGQSLNVSFLLVAPSQMDVGARMCITVRGPSGLLADLNRGKNRPSDSSDCRTKMNDTVKIHYESRPKHKYSGDGWCDNGTRMDLTYELQPDWIIYVTDEDKTLIYTHLMYTTVFLFILASTSVLYACVRGSSNRESIKYGGSRGDMELLRSHHHGGTSSPLSMSE